jgi:hypothetical protein
MNIIYLSKKEAAERFSRSDPYSRALTPYNLGIICPGTPNEEGYLKLLSESFVDITPREKKRLDLLASKLKSIDITICFALTNGCHPLDIIHTRGDCILSPFTFLSKSLLIHETYHIISRQNPELTSSLYPIFGFYRTPTVNIPENSLLVNPDALVYNFRIKVEHYKYGMIDVTPFMTFGLQTKLLCESGEVINPRETDYNSRMALTNYNSHPEEVCAEYFCYLFSKNADTTEGIEKDQIVKFRRIIKSVINLTV